MSSAEHNIRCTEHCQIVSLDRRLRHDFWPGNLGNACSKSTIALTIGRRQIIMRHHRHASLALAGRQTSDQIWQAAIAVCGFLEFRASQQLVTANE